MISISGSGRLTESNHPPPLFPVAIADAVQRFDGIEIVGNHLEFLPQPLDFDTDGI